MNDRDMILQKTNGGMTVFAHYMGESCHKKVFRNPFRTDNVPSCHLYYNEDKRGGVGRFILKDFGDSNWHGDCFWLVGKLTGLNPKTDFLEILRVIDRECELFILDSATSVPHPLMKKADTVPAFISKPVKFTPKYRNFNKYELDYWASYGISLDVLERYHVRCLITCHFERPDKTSFNLHGSLEIPLFGYTFNDGSGIKIYRPGAEICRFMYAGNLPKPYVFGLEQLAMLPCCHPEPFRSDEDFKKAALFITGGEKDVMSLAARGFNAICLNSETARMPESLLQCLLACYSPIIFLYDSDETGNKEASLRVAECRHYACVSAHHPDGHPSWKPVASVTLPLSGTKKEKDVSDFFRTGHSADELLGLALDAASSH